VTRSRPRNRIAAVRPLRVLPVTVFLTASLVSVQGAFAQGYGGTVGDILTRGESLLAQKRPNEAIVQFQGARTLCPTPAEMVQSYRGEAQGRIDLDDYLPAAGLLEEAAAKYPDDPRLPDILYRAALLRQRGGQADKAVALLRQALDKKPTPDLVPSVKLELAHILRMHGQTPEAIEVLKDFATDYPDSALLPTVLYTLAISHHDLKEYEQAEAIYRDLLKRFAGKSVPPAWAEAHFELASVLAERGKRREAAEYYKRYVALMPSSPYAAKALERAGDELLPIAPKSSAELYALARVKAAANPQPPIEELALSRFIGAKRTIAEALSRAWVLAIAGVLVIGALLLLGRGVVRLLRRRRSAKPETAHA